MNIAITIREQIFYGFGLIINNINRNNTNLFKQILYSMTFDKYYKIRANAIYYLSKLIKHDTSWKNIYLNRISDLMFDNNYIVRASIINVLKHVKMDKNDEYIVEKFTRDPHYIIRIKAKEFLNELIK
ncbi:MAG: hypothetical protein OEZ13_11220 [Spirochaetia bacterium]|nr:hypothetical protein [Spirochaetia bacterium]